MAAIHPTSQEFANGIHRIENEWSARIKTSSNDVVNHGESSSNSKTTWHDNFFSLFEYETPKVVTVHKLPLGIFRRLLQLAIISFVVLYQLWYMKGYQEFADVEASLTTKVKGLSMSRLTEQARERLPEGRLELYERVWDESDYVIPPSENNAFFVMTNVVLTPNQTRTTCPEDPGELPKIICGYRNTTTGEINITQGICVKGEVGSLLKSHGEATGNCILSDRMPDTYVCEIRGWCPVEVDRLPLNKEEGPLIPGVENYTVFIKNSISFTRFGENYHRTNMPHGICIYKPDKPDTHTCPIFRLGDIIDLANGSFTKISVKGGVVGVYINWNCDLDWDFEQYCLPKYKFRILDTFGWNFRHAYYHEENRRTLVKAYGLKFMVVVDGRGSKFDLKNTVIVLVTGLGLLGLSTMFCDFILLNYSTDRKRVKEKKYETVGTTSHMLARTMHILAASSGNLQPFRNPIRTGSIMNTIPGNNPAINANKNGTNNPSTTTNASNIKSTPEIENATQSASEQQQQANNTTTTTSSNTGNNKVVSNGGHKRSPRSLDKHQSAASDHWTGGLCGGQENSSHNSPPPPSSTPTVLSENHLHERLPVPASVAVAASVELAVANPPPPITKSPMAAAATACSTTSKNNSEVTTVLLQPAMKNHVVYSIDSKPKHLVEGSAL